MEQPISNNEKDDIAIRLSNVSCCWNEVQEVAAGNFALKETATPLVKALSNVSIDFRHGGLTCIIGTVGSGKSALMQALVGELQVHSGTLERRKGTLAYASQDPWIMNGTVKDNIVMGKDWDDEWYKEVVSACALLVDFQQLLNSDQTIVGDRGVQLSGGQRARVGLARAMYRDADVIVLDDPLSAVDSKVGRQLFNEAIQDLAISRGKCVVLATHQHQYVNEATCVLMAGGRIEKIGSYDECVAASKGKLTAHAADFSVDELPEVEPKEAKPVPVTVEEILGEKNGDSKKAGDDNKETKASGIVSIDTYIQYAKAMGGVWVAALLLLLYCITQASVLVTIATIGRWAERPEEEQDDWDILGLVIGLGCLVIFLSVFRAFVSFEITIKASRHLHDAMTQAVLRSKIEFFDTNPLGRILNRFSADVGSNDDLLPQTLLDFLVVLFIVLGAILTTFVVLPIALIALPPLVWYFLSVRKIFVTSTRELKRLEGLARSPIFAMLSEALSGIATIRANDSVKYFTEKFEAAHDGHTRAFFSFIACSRWAGFRMDSIMFALMSMVSFLSVLFQQEGWLSIDPAILGLSISMLLQLAGLFQWCIRQNAEVVNQFVSVERVLDFGSLESEASLELENDKNLGDWPERGEIDVKDLAVRYRPALPLALNGASFKIPSGARIGVVGRTGSGKSTVVQTLFRLLEAERGCISIDGVDISTVGLHTLRSKISVIPQAPTLFSGCTVRENLDLFGIHSEEAIQKALKDAHLAEAIAELPKGYDSMVSEGGTNFSVGQRQLLCLARAILSKSKILVLDEATASVDRRTDQLLHESLQESFGDATILAVAHRLDTVIDHDMILVLGQGKVLEYGTPADLIRSGGMFSKMIKDTGDTMSRDLRQRALAKENKDKTE
jgi:ATP-binding cassette subfamily C (CFTR/MRP) protein 4